MRRIALLLSVIMFIVGLPCLAESINLTELSVEELIDLELSIQGEIANRDTENSHILYSGYYIVGEDIEAGRYKAYVLKCDREEGGWIKTYYLKDSYTEDDIGEKYISNYYRKWNIGDGFKQAEGSIRIIEFYDRQQLEVQDCVVLLLKLDD